MANNNGYSQPQNPVTAIQIPLPMEGDMVIEQVLGPQTPMETLRDAYDMSTMPEIFETDAF